MSNISTYVEHIVQNLIVKTEQMDPTEINVSKRYNLKHRIIVWRTHLKYKSILGIGIDLRMLFNLIWLSTKNFVLTKEYMVRESFALMAGRI